MIFNHIVGKIGEILNVITKTRGPIVLSRLNTPGAILLRSPSLNGVNTNILKNIFH